MTLFFHIQGGLAESFCALKLSRQGEFPCVLMLSTATAALLQLQKSLAPV